MKLWAIEQLERAKLKEKKNKRQGAKQPKKKSIRDRWWNTEPDTTAEM